MRHSIPPASHLNAHPGRQRNPPRPSSLARRCPPPHPPGPARPPREYFSSLLLAVKVSSGPASPAGGSRPPGSAQGRDRSQKQLGGAPSAITPGRFPPAPSVSWFPHLESCGPPRRSMWPRGGCLRAGFPAWLPRFRALRD